MDANVWVQIAGAVATVAAVVVALWTSRSNTKEARRAKTREMRAASYLEVLRLVEHRAEYRRAVLDNWRACAGIGHPAFWDTVSRALPAKPRPDESAIVRAHLGAFASGEVRTLHQAWSTAMSAVEQAHEDVNWNHRENLTPDDEVTDEEFEILQPLHLAELAARDALVKGIADELDED